MRRLPSALMKIVRIDGRFHIVRSWSSDIGYTTEPVGDLLARTVYVGDDRISLYDALLEAGWMPPR